MEPNTISGMFAKVFEALAKLPIWLLASVSVAICVFLVTPAFSDLVSKDEWTWIKFADVLFSFLTIARVVDAAVRHFGLFPPVPSKTFHLTPDEQHSDWYVARQADDSLSLQLNAQLTVKNLTQASLYLPLVRLVRPKILQSLTHEQIIVEWPAQGFGSAQTGTYIPGAAFRKANIVIIGTVEHAPPPKPLSVLFEVTDADGNRQRLKMQLRCSLPK